MFCLPAWLVSDVCLKPMETRKGHPIPKTRITDILSCHVCAGN